METTETKETDRLRFAKDVIAHVTVVSGGNVRTFTANPAWDPGEAENTLSFTVVDPADPTAREMIHVSLVKQ